MATTAPMEVDEGLAVEKFSFHVLKLIKSAQAQHGGRYGDYQRYRRHCSSRLRRLYKSLKFLHGRGKYQKKELEPSHVSDVRHLHIPLYCAERAWGLAMELKQAQERASSAESGKADASSVSRKRAHLVKRLTRAARWADLFVRLCAEKADQRTALEAEAYAAYMWGCVLLEKETKWESALSKFLKASSVYSQLSTVGDVDLRLLCRQRAEEMEPSIRYCKYKMGQDLSTSSKANGGTGAELLGVGMGSEGPGMDMLQSKLEAVLEEARSQQASTVSELEWLGQRLPVLNAKTRVCVLKARQLEAELAAGSLSSERTLSTFDRLFVTYHDAKRLIRDDLTASGSAPDVREPLISLDRAVSALIFLRTMERNQVLVDNAVSKLQTKEQQQGQQQLQKKKDGEEEAREKGEGREKPTKPEDMVRLFDLLIQNASELEEILSSSSQQQEEEKQMQLELQAKGEIFRAMRCYFLAKSFSSNTQRPEAYLLFSQATTRAEGALKLIATASKNGSLSKHKDELARLIADCKAQRVYLHAHAVMEVKEKETAVQQKVEQLALVDKAPVPKDVKYLSETLLEYHSALPTPSSKSHHVTPYILQLPPAFRPIPCRPIVLDTALNAITFPSIEERAKRATKNEEDAAKGSGGGLFGSFWGARK